MKIGFTTDEQNQITAMRGVGNSYAQIADALNCKVDKVKTFCRSHNLGGVATDINIHICKNCAKALTTAHTGRPKIFCSDKCKNKWWNSRRGYHGS